MERSGAGVEIACARYPIPHPGSEVRFLRTDAPSQVGWRSLQLPLNLKQVRLNSFANFRGLKSAVSPWGSTKGSRKAKWLQSRRNRVS